MIVSKSNPSHRSARNTILELFAEKVIRHQKLIALYFKRELRYIFQNLPSFFMTYFMWWQ